MLISSKFKDYYDKSSKYGIDKTVIYNRETSTIPLPKQYNNRFLPYSETLSRDNAPNVMTLTFKVIGFCGKVYPLILAEHNKSLIGSSCFYSFSTLIKHLEINKIELISKNKYYFNHRNIEEMIKNFFNTNYNHLLNIFQTYNTPVFIIDMKMHNMQLTLNPVLREQEFVKVKDSFSTFQDIYMYISGVLTNQEKPIVEISDKDKQVSKGHYGKYSFKKPPGNGKWR